MSSEAKKEVERLLLSGRKIDAIRYLTDTFHVSMDEAKHLADTLEAELSTTQNNAQVDSASQATDSSLDDEVAIFLTAGQKILAIKKVSEAKSIGLTEALAYVQRVERERNIVTPSLIKRAGCGVLIFKMASITLAFIGISLLIGAGFVYYIEQDAVDNGTRVLGTVIDLQEDSDGGSYAPVISYTWQAEQRQFTGSVYSNPPSFEIGEQVAIFIDADNPDHIVIDSFTDRWLVVIILGIFGCLLLVFSFVTGAAGRRGGRAAV